MRNYPGVSQNAFSFPLKRKKTDADIFQIAKITLFSLFIISFALSLGKISLPVGNFISKVFHKFHRNLYHCGVFPKKYAAIAVRIFLRTAFALIFVRKTSFYRLLTLMVSSTLKDMFTFPSPSSSLVFQL